MLRRAPSHERRTELPQQQQQQQQSRASFDRKDDISALPTVRDFFTPPRQSYLYRKPAKHADGAKKLEGVAAVSHECMFYALLGECKCTARLRQERKRVERRYNGERKIINRRSSSECERMRGRENRDETTRRRRCRRCRRRRWR